ncbi:hypothetical protein A1O7_07593 [Cladophialophora yegresii CBS 114405]|uniref:VOC domain-containing protein n=1 Tax=Cladophialophora yegresii CBS 114405 TaxID=1182544 RepID=W9VYC2_9EURO|nr:uncharacterized protein A1O7_07593 [Cladophialophora yegresii CBS 114405]EXJ57246.1 hypothetical protein A1O7_07593 [Cladophialophora yegresii CBS 114405]
MPSSITLTVSHLPTSTSFFLSTLQPLGYVFRGRQEQTIGFGPEYPPNTPADFWITQEIPGVPAGAAHVAFPAASRANVQEFFVAALKAGGKIHGEPCQRDSTGYYSAAVIDFDGNSIEAVHRPGLTGEANKENVDARSVVSHRTGSVKAPSTVGPAKSVVSQARSKAPTTVAPPQSVVSQAKSQAPSQMSAASTKTPEQTQPKPSGDVLNTLINEARSAANVARDLVTSFKGNVSSTPPSVPSNTATGGGIGAGEAIVGTLLGVAAGAALHYAFSNRSKDNASDDDRDAHQFQPRRPSVAGRSVTEPPAILRPVYSSAPSDYQAGYVGGGFQRAIEPAPSAFTYSSRNNDDQKLITMQDNEPGPPAPTAITYHSHASPKSDYASTIRPTSVTRRMSMDSGFGPGPRDIEAASHAASSKASTRHSKKSSAPPPTSYRAPSVLTEKMSRVSGAKGDGSGKEDSSGSRTSSLIRLGRSLSQASRSLAAGGDAPPRSRSQSRHSTRSRRSRRDDFEAVKGEVEEVETVLHVAGKSSTSIARYPVSNGGGGSKAGSKAPSRAGSKHHPRACDPAEYPLPPSRAATWTGSDAGRSFVSARSNFGPNGRVGDAPRTVIGRLRSEQVEKADTASVVSKQKELKDLDVTDREVGPEDSVSQISVESRRSRRSKASTSRR